MTPRQGVDLGKMTNSEHVPWEERGKRREGDSDDGSGGEEKKVGHPMAGEGRRGVMSER